jgi:hypothetical protein
VFQACVAVLAEVINALEKLGSLVLLFKLFLIRSRHRLINKPFVKELGEWGFT